MTSRVDVRYESRQQRENQESVQTERRSKQMIGFTIEVDESMVSKAVSVFFHLVSSQSNRMAI